LGGGSYCLLNSTCFSRKLRNLSADADRQREEAVSALKLQLNQVTDRLNRLTDAFIDGALDKDGFEQRKAALIGERRQMDESLTQWQSGKHNLAEVSKEFSKARMPPV